MLHGILLRIFAWLRSVTVCLPPALGICTLAKAAKEPVAFAILVASVRARRIGCVTARAVAGLSTWVSLLLSPSSPLVLLRRWTPWVRLGACQVERIGLCCTVGRELLRAFRARSGAHRVDRRGRCATPEVL